MQIRNTKKEDLQRVMEIYAYARKFMASTGNPNQWGPTNWPPLELIEQDIKNKKSYVCEEDGKVIAVFFFDYGKSIEPTYANIEDGAWIGNEDYGVVHRIATDGSKKSVGKYCIEWAYKQCRHLRIDTHNDNKVMQKVLKNIGFKECGTIYVVEDNAPRIAYELTGEKF